MSEWITGRITKMDEDRKLIFGWAYIAKDESGRVVVDTQGDYISEPWELEKAAYNYVIKARDMSDTHVRKGQGTLVESFVFTPEKRSLMGIPEGVMPEVAWWVGFRVEDDTLWKAAKDQEYVAFSIGGIGKRNKAQAPEGAVRQWVAQ